jgi:hypothetical protein
MVKRAFGHWIGMNAGKRTVRELWVVLSEIVIVKVGSGLDLTGQETSACQAELMICHQFIMITKTPLDKANSPKGL